MKKYIGHFYMFIFLFCCYSGQVAAQCNIGSLFTPVPLQSTVCSGTQLKVTGPSGFQISGWVYRDSSSGAWTLITNYQATLTQTLNTTKVINREYRMLFSNVGCGPDTTAPVMVTVQPYASGNNNTVLPSLGADTVCSGLLMSCALGVGNYEIEKWIYKNSSDSQWTVANMTGGHDANMKTDNITAYTTRQVRVLLRTYGVCSIDTSGSRSFVIKPKTPKSSGKYILEVNRDSICGGSVHKVSWGFVTHVNCITGNWLYRDNGTGSWNVFANGGGHNYDSSTLVTNRTVRQYRAVYEDNNTCSIDTTAPATTIITKPVYRTIPLALNVKKEYCANESYVYVSTPVNYPGIVLKILKQVNDTGNWIDIGFASNDPIPSGINTVVKWSYRVIFFNSQACTVDTSLIASTKITPRQYGITKEYSLYTKDSVVCAGKSVTISIPGNTTKRYWYMQENDTSMISFIGYAVTGTDVVKNLMTSVTRSYMALIDKPSGCGADTTTRIKVIHRANTYGKTGNSFVPYLNQSNNCSDAVAELYVTLPNTYNINKWIYNDVGASGWFDVPNAESNGSYDEYFNPTVNASRRYKAIVRDNERCLIDSTLTTTSYKRVWTYNTDTSLTLSTTTPEICSGGTINVLFNAVNTTMRGYVWSDNGTTWNYSNQTSNPINTSFSTSVTSNTIRTFKVIVRNLSECRYDTSAAISIAIKARQSSVNPNATVLTSVKSVCVGETVSLSASFGLGIDYKQWIYRDGPSQQWVLFSGSTGSTAGSTIGYVPSVTNRDYRVVYENDNNCTRDTTSPAFVLIHPLQGGTNTSIQPTTVKDQYCSGSPVTISAPSGTTVQRWFYADGTNSWREIPSSGVSYPDPYTEVTQNISRRYRFSYKRTGTCFIDTSMERTVTIRAITNGVSTTTPTVLSQHACSGYPVEIYPNRKNVNEASIETWIYSDDGFKWRGMSSEDYSTNSSFYKISNTSVTKNTIRYYRMILENRFTCSYDTSQAVSVLIKPLKGGYALNVTPIMPPGAFCNDTSISVYVFNPPSAPLFWEYRTTNQTWITCGVGNNTLLNNSFSPTKDLFVRLTLYNQQNCSIDTSNVVQTMVAAPKRGNNYLIKPTVTSTQVCTNKTEYITLTVPLPPLYSNLERCIYKDNNGPWQEFKYTSALQVGPPQIVITDYNIDVTVPTVRAYKVLLYSNSNQCMIDTSDEVSVNLLPPSKGYLVNKTPASSSPTYMSGNIVKLSIQSISGYSIDNWIYTDRYGAVQATYVPSNKLNFDDANSFTDSTYGRNYYAVFFNNTTCSYDTTNKVTVTLVSKSQVVPGIINVSPQLLSPSAICSGDSVKLKVSPPAGYYVDQWLFKDSLDNVWRPANVSRDTIVSHIPVFVSSVTRRFYRVILTDSITKKDSSLTVALTINPTGYRKNTDLNISGNSIACKGTTLTLTGTATGSTVGTNRFYLKWIFRNSTLSEWEDINAGSMLTDDNTLSSGFNRNYAYIQYNYTTCTIDTSNEKTVTISSYGAGTLNTSYKATVTLDSICSSASSISITSNTGASAYGWQFRDNYTNPWLSIYNAKTSSFTHPLQMASANRYRQYRPLTLNATCMIDTGMSDTILIKGLARGRITTLTPTAPQSSYCSGNPVSLVVSPGSGNTLLKWLFRNDSNSAWSVLPVAVANNAVDYNSVVNTTVTRQYCVVVRRTSCSEDTSNSVNVTIRPYSAGANSLAITPAPGSLCAGAQVTLTVVPGSNKSVEKWIYRDQVNAAWSDLFVGNTAIIKDYNTYVSTTTNRYYRTLIFNSLTCSTDTSSQASVLITPVTSGTITDTPKVSLVNVCARGKAVLQYKPANGTVINWLVSVNNSAWKVLVLATDTIYTDSLTYINVPETRKYRVVVRNNISCSIDTTREIAVNYAMPQFTSTGGITLVRPDSALCAGLVTKITCNLPSNKLMYDWMYKDGINGSWNRVTNALSSYTETGSGSIMSLTNRYYRALVFDPAGCTIDSSQQVYVVYKPSSYTYTGTEILSGPDSTCSGNTVSISVPYKAKKLNLGWLAKSVTGAWEVFNRDSVSYLTHESVPSTQSKTVTFRSLRIDSATCSIDSSVAKSIKFRARGSGFTNDSFYTSGNVCGGTAVMLNYTGSRTPYLWEYRDTAGAWQALNARMETMSYALDDLTKVLVTTTRKYRLIVLNDISCRLDSIRERTITITPLKTGNSALQPNASATVVCAGLPVNISLSSVQIDHWIFKDNSGSWQRMTQGNSSSVTDFNTNVPANIQRSYRAVIKSSSTCSFDTSTSVTVSINKTPGAGNSSVQTQTTRTVACSGTSVQLSVPGSSQVVKWLYRDGVTGAWTAINSASTTFNDSVTVSSSNINRYYRALLDNSTTACSFDTTIERMVTFTLTIPGTNASVVPSSPGSSYCSGALINLQVNPGSSYQVKKWFAKNNSAAWMLLADTMASSITDTSTNATVNTTRQYRVLMYNASNCNQDTSGALSVTIKPLVRAVNNSIVPVVSKAVICAGATVQISVSLSSGAVSGWLIRDTTSTPWNVYAAGNPYSDSLTGSPNVKTRMYRVLVSNSSACTVDTSAQVSVSIIPKPSINRTLMPSASKSVYCSGETLPVQIGNYTGSLLGWTYRNDSLAAWAPIPSSGVSAYTHTNTTTGTKILRQYRASFNTGCENDSSAIVSVTIDAVPPLPSIIRSGDSLICTVTGAGFTYKWKRNGTYIAETNPKFVPSQSGTYVVEVANGSGCQSVSVSFNFIGTFVQGGPSPKSVWQIYPNPSYTGKFRVETAYPDDIEISFEIFNSQGQRTNISGLIKPVNGHFDVNLSNMAQGMYFIRVKAAGEEAWFKILFE